MDNVYVRLVPLPQGVHEIVSPFEDGYNIYIDDMLDERARMDAYYHAIGHIDSNDWQCSDVQKIEGYAHL